MNFIGRHRREQIPVGSQDLEDALQTGVRRAAGHYGAGRYGRGEYELVRLALHVARRYDDQGSAAVFADLRFVQEPPRPMTIPGATT